MTNPTDKVILDMVNELLLTVTRSIGESTANYTGAYALRETLITNARKHLAPILDDNASLRGRNNDLCEVLADANGDKLALQSKIKRLEGELEPHREKLADIKDANDKLDKSRKQ